MEQKLPLLKAYYVSGTIFCVSHTLTQLNSPASLDYTQHYILRVSEMRSSSQGHKVS